jgi:hypothetical protein
MIEKLSQKDIRALKMGAIGVVVIFVFVFASEFVDRWAQARNSLDEMNGKLDLIDVDKAKREGLMSIVPVFEMPKDEQTQRFQFRDKLTEQLNKAKINNKPLQEVTGGKSPQEGYRLLRMKCSAKCKFGQVLDLLANLKDNPYLVGIEELRLKCDAKKPQEVEMDLTVSTFVK